MANQQYLLVNAQVLPSTFTKVVEVKNLLSKGNCTVNEAVKQVGISRSAYYKYKDYVVPFYETIKGKVVTLFFV